MQKKHLYVPAPWNLTGSAYIMFLRGTPMHICMLVHYETSPVGAYDEIVFIPGKISYNKKKFWSVSDILVSNAASAISGRKNWGLPKALAEFTHKKDARHETITISQQQKIFAEFCFQTYGPSLPVNTNYFPSSLYTLMQTYKNKHYWMTPKARGSVRLATVHNIKIESDDFPDISKMRNLLTLHIPQFQLHFPSAIVSKIN